MPSIVICTFAALFIYFWKKLKYDSQEKYISNGYCQDGNLTTKPSPRDDGLVARLLSWQACYTNQMAPVLGAQVLFGLKC